MLTLHAQADASWKVDLNTYVTRWSRNISPTNVYDEYPRPIMTRSNWLNLNGLWDCGYVRSTNLVNYTAKILVPFPVESILAGTRHVLTEFERLCYRRTFDIPPNWHGQRILLHFEAVDWEADVWLNGHEIGKHRGGYDRFSFDITDQLELNGRQELVVFVSDPTDAGDEPRGKQMIHPRLPYLNAASGIWQTVWLEPVPTTAINSIKLVPDLDKASLLVEVFGSGQTNAVSVVVTALAGDKIVGQATGKIGQPFSLPLDNVQAWTPDDPYLYDLKVSLLQGGQKIDEVGSYFGMRKISVSRGAEHFQKVFLNNQPVFQLGVLDQGYWPDGIYTAPSDEALRSDIELVKRLGFNLIRKHVKIEPERWYYWCDKLGVLVWQDMPSGNVPVSKEKKEIVRTADSASQFEQELKQMIVGRGNHPSIVTWIPFNQGWGQYDTVRITRMVKELDPSRLVIDASGWNDFGIGDVRSLHQYPGPPSPMNDGKRANVVGECGGLGYSVPDHLWSVMTHWNTTTFDSTDKLLAAYTALLQRIEAQKDDFGLSGAVITELTDVQSEDNGFITYDRQIIKMPVDKVRQLNQKLLQSDAKKPSMLQHAP